MNQRTIIFAAILVICSCLVFIYTNLTDMVVIFHPVRTLTIDGEAERVLLPHVRISEIRVSPALRNAIPRTNEFWNRRFHDGLKKLDNAGNRTQSEIIGNYTLESTEYLHTNIKDFDSYPPMHQDFVRSMYFRSPDFLINQPNKCTSNGKPDNVTLLYALKSNALNFLQRQAIRQTWGQERVYEGGFLVRTVFLLATSSSLDYPDLGMLLSLEAQQFGDLLIWDYKDTLFNLTLKEHVFLKWSILHCPQVSFIFKGDDDIYVNTRSMLEYLKSLEPAKKSKLYVGHLMLKTWPGRVRNKYYIPLTFYKGPYPAYLSGGAFVFSGALLESLYSISWYIPFHPIDDVYTGMCFLALDVAAVDHEGFKTCDVTWKEQENPCLHKDLIMVHQRSPTQIMHLWRTVNSPLLNCSKA